ncbi:MAG TPA: anti-sigma factor [Candidatus Limnocylindrales bacterium]|nr:anti-sigma factor [Candidatus Limnocylindrales bacterium]
MSVLSCEQVRDLAEGFVLGALDPVQTHDVRDHLATCTEAHPEMDELGAVVPYLAESVEPVEPPVELKGRITAAIEAELRAGRRADAAADRLISSLGAGSVRPAAAAVVETPSPAPAPVAERLPAPAPIDLATERARRRSPVRWLAAIAAVLVIAALGAWNIGLSSQLSTAQQQQAAVDRVLAIAQQPGGQAAILVPGAGGGPAGLAAVASDGSFALAMHGLAATSGSQVYEAWVIAPSGSPVPIGSFAVGSDGNGALSAARVPVASGLTVGLTREPNAGATTPTLPMVVSGVTAQGS